MKSLTSLLLLLQSASPLEHRVAHTSRKRRTRHTDTTYGQSNLRGHRSLQTDEAVTKESLLPPSNTLTDASNPLTDWKATSYLATHPYYPSHTSSTCIDARITPPEEWMTLQNGYAENHLFETRGECCERWGFDDCDGGDGDAGGETSASASDSVDVDVDVGGEGTEERTAQTTPAAVVATEALLHDKASAELETTTSGPTTKNTVLDSTTEPIDPRLSTFPTFSCGATLEEANSCTTLCLSGFGCPEGQSCFNNVPCPSDIVAASMGPVGEAISNLLDGGKSQGKQGTNVCGDTYEAAEATCIDGYTEAFVECPDGATCPEGMWCYVDILCPIPPTASPTLMPTDVPTTSSPTGKPVEEAVVDEIEATIQSPVESIVVAEESDMLMFEEFVEEPLNRRDKTEIVGIPVVENPRPAPVPAPSTEPLTSPSNESPYTIDKSTLGTISVAATSCTGGCPSGSTCVGNQAGGQLIKDEECSACATGQTWWPCDVQGLCWCWLDGTDRIAPAPESGVEITVEEELYTVCDDILTKEIFDIIAPEHKEPYSYQGLCDAILSYNAHHTEKAFGMGDSYQRAAELAAFLGNTLHESDEFKAGREYLMCADRKTVGDQVYCKPCDSGSFDWATFTCPVSLITGTAEFNEYCQPDSVPPEACNCGNGKGQSGELEGYVPAKDLFFGRGAIQLSWNYNYIGASIALTGSPDTFCENPDLVATEGKYAWGAGLFFWMEHSKEGTTCHTESLKNLDFGGTLNNINGGLECPAHGGWHEEAVKARLNRYCRASKALGLPNLMTLSGCAGLEDKMAACLSEGTCTDCQDFVGTNAGEHNTSYSPPISGSAPAAPVQEPSEAEPIESPCGEGLMALDGHPDCCVPNTAFIGDGACDPEAPYNTEICGWDGGDCCRQTCNIDSAFGCKTKEGGELGEYGPFGFYCLDPSQGGDVIDSVACSDVEKERIGDGKCDPMYNTEGCLWDGGDCCEESCHEEFAFYPCGSGVQSYVCMDPRFKVETSEPTPGPTPAPVQTSESPTNFPTPRPTPKTQKPTPKAPTIVPSSPSTPDLTRAPVETTPDPTHAPVDTTFDSVSSDSFASTEQFSEGNYSNEDSTCPSDFKECKNTGEFVTRDPENNCRFRPCGEESLPVDTEATESSNNGEEMPCPSDFKECKGTGIFVTRDPRNGCKFNPCPDKKEEEPEEEDATPEVNNAASSFVNAVTEPQDELESSEATCPSDFKECKGTGAFVTRDPEKNCRFRPCPFKEKETLVSFDSSEIHPFSSLVESAMIGHSKGKYKPQAHAEDTGVSIAPVKSEEVMSCPQDVRECLDGTFVGRNPANGCRYFPCTNSLVMLDSNAKEDTQNKGFNSKEEEAQRGGHSKTSMATSVSQALGGLHSKGSDEVKVRSSLTVNGDSETVVVEHPDSSTSSLASSSSSQGITLHSEVKLKPTDDASVYKAHETRNYGTEDELKIANSSGKIHSLLRFDLSSILPVNENVQHATLRLWATDSASTSGGSVESASDSDWDESTVTWSDAPQGNHDFSDTLGVVVAGTWYGLNVTPLLKNAVSRGNKFITLRLSASNQNSGGYASKEFMGGKYSPFLVVDVFESSATTSTTQENRRSHQKGNRG